MPPLRYIKSTRSDGGKSRGWRFSLVASVIAVAVLFMGSAPAGAADTQDATVGLIITRGAPGDVVDLATIGVDADLVGRACTLSATVYNQFSVNEDNNVVVATGGSQMTLSDVEAVADQTTTGSIDVVAGETVTFTLVRGSKVFSAHMSMSLECAEKPATTTTTTTTTTTEKPAIAESTTTTTVATTTLAPTTTAPTGEVAPAPPAQPQPGQPTFTG